MNQLGLRRKIDQLVPVDSQCQTTVGDAVQLLVLDILSGRNALVHVDKWAEHLDMETLVRHGLQAAWFNDDALGHHLDGCTQPTFMRCIQCSNCMCINMKGFRWCVPRRYNKHVGLRRLHETERIAANR
ncbi:DUF4277 domain-containing protein [Halalkalibacter sp. APA_J-10(15)]|uniref:DUF4277 domain-containing protein n=1 Tax=Halalkalibacter sp. APA_J-10(15) TaxID=2933805 RepID=UPI0034D45C0E